MFLFGDLHANSDNELYSLLECPKDQKYIVILGDGGLLWHNDEYSGLGGTLIKILDSLGKTIIIIPGNHENYKRIYGTRGFPPRELVSLKNTKGVFVKITDNIYYTARCGAYEIEGKNILVLGGAKSLDKEYRVEGKTWFPEETFSLIEKDYIRSQLLKDYDYVFAHTCPAFVLKKIFSTYIRDNNAEFFDEVFKTIYVKKWFFGHLHPEKNDARFKNLIFDDTEFICLYKDLTYIL